MDLAEPMTDAFFDRIYDAFLCPSAPAVPGPAPGARRPGDLRPPLRLGPGACDEPVPRRGLSRDLLPLEPGADGRPSGKHPDRGTVHWHTDGSWARRTGQATLLYAVAVPAAGGETRFASMYDAYEALDEGMRQRLAALRAVHNLDFSRTRRHGEDLMTEEQKKARPPVAHPIVRIHPETGRRCIFLGDHAWYIEDMPFDEGRQLIEDLNAAIIDAGARLHAPVAPGRPGHLGQPLHAAQGGALRRRRRSARDAPLHRGRRGPDLARGSDSPAAAHGRSFRKRHDPAAPFGLTGARRLADALATNAKLLGSERPWRSWSCSRSSR